MGFLYNGAHSSAHGITVTGINQNPILGDIRMGQWSQPGQISGCIIDPMTTEPGVLSLSMIVEKSSAQALQEALDGIRSWLNPLAGLKYLFPDWLIFPGSELSRGWRAILNSPLLEQGFIPGRFAVRTQASFLLKDGYALGRNENALNFTISGAGTQVFYAPTSSSDFIHGDLPALPTWTIHNTETIAQNFSISTAKGTISLILMGSRYYRLDALNMSFESSSDGTAWTADTSMISIGSSAPIIPTFTPGERNYISVVSGGSATLSCAWRARWRG